VNTDLIQIIQALCNVHICLSGPLLRPDLFFPSKISRNTLVIKLCYKCKHASSEPQSHHWTAMINLQLWCVRMPYVHSSKHFLTSLWYFASVRWTEHFTERWLGRTGHAKQCRRHTQCRRRSYRRVCRRYAPWIPVNSSHGQVVTPSTRHSQLVTMLNYADGQLVTWSSRHTVNSPHGQQLCNSLGECYVYYILIPISISISAPFSSN